MLNTHLWFTEALVCVDIVVSHVPMWRADIVYNSGHMSRYKCPPTHTILSQGTHVAGTLPACSFFL